MRARGALLLVTLTAVAAACAVTACTQDFGAFEGDVTATPAVDGGRDGTTPASDSSTPVTDGSMAGDDAAANCGAVASCKTTQTTCNSACDQTHTTCTAGCQNPSCKRKCDDDRTNCKAACTTTCKSCAGASCPATCN